MDFYTQSNQPPHPSRKSGGWKIFFIIVLIFSIIANVLLLAGLGASSAVLAGGRGDFFTQRTVEKGTSPDKIAVISIEGIIDNKLAAGVISKLKAAQSDESVKAVILRTNTPGGSVSASDRLYDGINRLRKETGKPAIAFMETLAASGGFYTSCACDKIIAEPTAITGSIGVIFGHFVFQELLEQKLGIKPSIVKSGEKKDWPTAFSPVSEEQLAYLQERLIQPAYKRFVSIAAEGRKEFLTAEEMLVLADGSIYTAEQALANKLIDQIGYMPEAIALARSLADANGASVVEYQEPFSFKNWLLAEGLSRFNIGRFSPYGELMYIWDGVF